MVPQESFTEYTIEIMHCKIIRSFAKEKKLDLVLVNDAVMPFICKLYNYRDHMYERFKKEYLTKHIEKGKLIRIPHAN